MKITYHKGTILIKGDYSIPNTKWDSRSGCYRSQAVYYRDIVEYLDKSGISYEDSVLDLIPCPDLACKATLRGYQEDALEQWLLQKKRCRSDAHGFRQDGFGFEDYRTS